MFVAYLRTFARMGLKAIPMRADTGPIGGDLSHEFIVLAETGESAVFCHKGLVDKDILSRTIDYGSDLQPIVNEWTRSTPRPTRCTTRRVRADPRGERLAARGIEVGHIFYFGTRYSQPMKAVVAGPKGEQVTVRWGPTASACRAWSAASSRRATTSRHRLAESVAPFRVAIVNLKPDDGAVPAPAASSTMPAANGDRRAARRP
jgi:prolyl-tRNA synthetase